jgi:hypothetical protein
MHGNLKNAIKFGWKLWSWGSTAESLDIYEKTVKDVFKK